MKKILLGISLSFLAGSALAADLAPRAVEPVAPVAVAPVFSWTGFYAGAQAGYLWGDSTLHFPITGNSGKIDPRGALIGGQAGYNYQFVNGLVLGADVDMDWSLAKHRVPIVRENGAPVSGEFVKGDLNWTGALRARVGYGFDRFLPYLSGGVAFGDYKHTLYSTTETPSKSQTLVGWTMGAGLDYAITDNWVTGIEYRYTDYGTKSFHNNEVGFFDPHRLNLSTNDVRLKASYKF